MKRVLAIATVLAVVAVLAVPLAVSADSGNTTINGSVTAVASLNIPYGTGTNGAIGLGAMTVGTNNGTGITAGSVTDNNANGYDVTVESNSKDGHMFIGAVELKDPLLVTTGTLITSPTAIGGAVNCVSSASPTATISIPLTVSQNIYNNDAAGSYSIVLTYTLTERK